MAVERELVIKFTGKDAGLSATASVSGKAIAGLGESVKTTAKSSQFLIDKQGRLKDAQGQFVDATKLSSKELEKLRSELLASGQNVALFDKNLKESRANMLAFAGVAGGIGASIGGIFAKGQQEFLAFEGGIKQAGVVSGASAEQLGVLRDEVERLGIVTSKAPAEIAQTSVSLSRAGFTAEETTAALEGVARASEATGESLGTVGDIISKTTRTFGLAADEAGNVGDILVATANNTNTTVSSIGESLSYVGAVAKASNQPLEDIAIAIGLLGDAGIQGSSAGTGLVAALDGLKQASAGAESEFTSLVRGNSKRVEAFELLNTTVRNADGSMNSIIAVLPEMKKGLESLSQQDQDIVLKALFGVQGGRTVQTLLNATEERVGVVTQKVREFEGQATASGEGMLRGLGGALSLLQGSAGATLIKFGELTAVGFEPLVRAATNLLNFFLRLPPSFQAVIVGTTALAGALAGAIALLTTYNALQLGARAASIASAGATATLTAAQTAHAAITTAVNVATTIMNVSITKQTALLGVNTAATKAAAIAKQAYAVATGTAGAATVALVGKLAILAAQAALVTGAIFAVGQVFKRSEGAEFASDLNEAVKELENTRMAADDTADSVDDLGGKYSNFIDNLRETGPVEAAQTFLSELTNSTGRYGNQLGIITREQRGNQIAQIATAEAIQKLGSSTQETTDLLAQFGQAFPDGRQLSAGELENFTAAVADQSKALQEEIELLKASKGQSAELDQQLDNEIGIRESLIRTLENRVSAQGGETAAVDAATDAARGLSEVLDELDSKYAALSDSANLVTDQALAETAKQEAEGLLSQADAEAKTLSLERTQLSASIERNQSLLKELREQRSQRTGDERAEIDKKILETQKDIAQDERRLAKDRIDVQRDAAKEAEKLAKETAKAEEKTEKERLEKAKEAAKERADLLKESQQEEARIREEAFSDRQREEETVFSDQQDGQQQQFDDQLRAEEEAFEEQQRTATAAFEKTQQSKESAFNAGQQSAEDRFKQSLNDRQEAFNNKQRLAEQAFSDRQRDEDRAFADRQSAAKEAAEGRFAARRVEIERKLQLEDAAPEDRKALKAQFKEEDEEAARQERAFAALVAAEQAFEEAQAQEKIAFEESQREAERAFKQQQQVEQQTFEATQQAVEAEFELQQREAARLFKEEQKLADQAFAEQQREAERLFEEEKRSREREFQLVLQNAEREFEEAQRERERAFRQEQREQDRQNAIAIQQILDGAEATPVQGTQAQSLRGGGVAEGGVVQVHRDEFLVPPKGTRVVSQQDSRRLVQEYMIANPLTQPIGAGGQAVQAAQVAGGDYSGIPERLDTLIKAVQSQRKTFKTGGNQIQINGAADPTAAAQKIMLDQLRAIARI